MQVLTEKTAVTAAETRTYYAQVVVPGCDVAANGQLVDGTVDLLVGEITVGPGEIKAARAVAESTLPDGCWVSCVWSADSFDVEF